jgi:ATP-dependent exoDNAse (exonuclease V) alpha subunit
MTTDTLDSIVLTADQNTALDALFLFLIDPVETVFVLSGYSGCGKSTLVRTLLDQMPNYIRTAKLINPSQKEFSTQLTATTNKAAENLYQITGHEVCTIHSFLGLRVETDYRTNVSKLVARQNFTCPEDTVVFIDEASYVDRQLLDMIFKRTHNCKIVFIGDPAQLTPVKATSAPVFEAGFTGAALTTVVRQAEGNPIVDLSTKFRHTVNTGEFFGFTPDGHHIRRLDRAAFNQAIEDEFTRPDWKYADSKILAWTNKCVIGYNQYVRNLAKGDPHFQAGDYAVCNSFLTLGRSSIKTDQLVQITRIEKDSDHYDVPGNWMTIDHGMRVFQPRSLQEKNNRLKLARAQDDFHTVSVIESSWIDLRGAYACTINKAQGSTFGSVFIDLDDVGGCNSGDQIARMLYVGVSRAKNHVYLTGDLA